MIVFQEAASDWLSRSEQEATQHLHNSVNEWVAFCKIALAIQDSGLWKETSPTWHEYVRLIWHIDSSRIRQYKGALSYVDKIMATIDDVSTPESDIRKLKTVIDADNPLMPQVYQLGIEAAKELESKVQTSFFEHALEVLEEAQTTGGFVDIAGAQIPADYGQARLVATVHSILEAEKRQKAHIMQGKQSFTVTAKRIADNQYLVTSDNPLPETFQFKLWKDVDHE